MPLSALVKRASECRVVKGGDIYGCAKRSHHSAVPLKKKRLRDERLEPAGRRTENREEHAPRSKRRVAYVRALLDDHVLEEELEERHAEPVARERGHGHERRERLHDREAHVRDRVPEEGEERRCERRERLRLRGVRDDVDDLVVCDELAEELHDCADARAEVVFHVAEAAPEDGEHARQFFW